MEVRGGIGGPWVKGHPFTESSLFHRPVRPLREIVNVGGVVFKLRRAEGEHL